MIDKRLDIIEALNCALSRGSSLLSLLFFFSSFFLFRFLKSFSFQFSWILNFLGGPFLEVDIIRGWILATICYSGRSSNGQ